MKYVIENKVSGKDKGKWSWSVTSDSGRVIASAIQVFDSKDACLKEAKAVMAASSASKLIVNAVPSAKSPAPGSNARG